MEVVVQICFCVLVVVVVVREGCSSEDGGGEGLGVD
jgi:hypothetical protein